MTASTSASAGGGRQRLVTPEEVQAVRDILGPQIEATAKLITDAVPDDVRAGWIAFARGWARSCSEAPSWSQAPAQLTVAEQQGRLLRMWLSVLAANYIRAPQGAGSVEQVGWLPTFVLPSDVIALKKRLDPYVRGFDQKIATCREIPDDVRTTWLGVSKSWRDFFDDEVGVFHVGTQMDRGETFERDLIRWQKTLDGYKCTASGPGVPRLHVQENEPFDDPDAPKPLPSEWPGAFKTVAIAGAVVAAFAFASRYRPKGA